MVTLLLDPPFKKVNVWSGLSNTLRLALRCICFSLTRYRIDPKRYRRYRRFHQLGPIRGRTMNHFIRVSTWGHDDYPWVRVGRLRRAVRSPVADRFGLEVFQDHVQAA